MKNKFTSKDLKSFVTELEDSDEEKLKELIERYLLEYKEYLLGICDGDTYETGYEEVKETILMTESPIERIFYIALKNQLNNFGFVVGDGSFDITPQQKVSVNQTNYRVDFSLSYFDGFNKAVVIFVELNGHEYHNSSKNKITKDRKRERELQVKCNRMMTFTGTEIFKDTDGCAHETLFALKSAMKREGIQLNP